MAKRATRMCPRCAQLRPRRQQQLQDRLAPRAPAAATSPPSLAAHQLSTLKGGNSLCRGSPGPSRGAPRLRMPALTEAGRRRPHHSCAQCALLWAPWPVTIASPAAGLRGWDITPCSRRPLGSNGWEERTSRCLYSTFPKRAASEGLSESCHFLLQRGPSPNRRTNTSLNGPTCAQVCACLGGCSHHVSKITQRCHVFSHIAPPKFHLSCLRALLRGEAPPKQKHSAASRRRWPLTCQTRPQTLEQRSAETGLPPAQSTCGHRALWGEDGSLSTVNKYHSSPPKRRH